MNGITVKQLAALCMKEIQAGNSEKIVLISSDDEGNSFHTLFYGFTSSPEEVAQLKENSYFHDDNNPADVVVLG